MADTRIMVVRIETDDKHFGLSDMMEIVQEYDGIEIVGIEWETEKVPQNEPVDDPFKAAARRMTR